MSDEAIITKLAEDQSGWSTCKIWITINPLNLSKENLSKAEYFEGWKWFNLIILEQLKIDQGIYVVVKLIMVGKLKIEGIEPFVK